jgi:hypothetical protein
MRGLKEDPAQGTQATYQLIPDEKYETFENCIFMPPTPIAALLTAAIISCF